ncbi:MAG TPA: trigger factor [Candidatus Eubacterium pullicola]|uniref:Trigger factor n=1 Tax=Gallibacter intestinalis TaxID=2779356 RepID=A0ABR9QWL1_9FIRM|nr:trigger factor [Gallibacter intestinalis]MBE5035258.1 trigger factor [Gallibacter intestinalis]HIW39806.1 trigger factor [Candidatus Eubacterium pullicola]
MKATLLAKENGDAKFTIEFTAEEFEAARVKAYQENKNQFTIDGFRKGKAPRSIIEKRYGDVFAEDAINDMLADGYPNALDELDIEVIDQPRMEFGKIEKDAPFTVTVTVAVYPEVEVKDYKGIELEKVDAEVTDEDVNTEIENLRKRNARMVTVDREVKDGDHIILDYKGFVGDEQFEGGTAEGYPLVIGSGSFIPGFEDQLIGAKKDEEVEVKVTFPEEYHAEELAGKEAVFKCVVHEVKEEELPELDDEFAKDVSEYDTLEELKKETKEDLTKRKSAWAENQMKDKAVEIVCENNDIEIPAVMIDDEISQMIRELDMQLSQQGLSFQQYLQFLGKDMMAFREEVKDDAERRVKMRMVIRAIVDAEAIVATEEEIEKELELLGIQYGLETDKVKEMVGEKNLEYIGQDVKMKKAVDFIYENAKVK